MRSIASYQRGLLACLLAAVSAIGSWGTGVDESMTVIQKTHSELSINDVMRDVMTKGLCQRVIKQQATLAEQQELVVFFQRLGEQDPPLGSHQSWNTLTTRMLQAAVDISQGKPAHEDLRKATNCIACHRKHRPR